MVVNVALVWWWGW